jgi:hypothetical protein
VSTYRHNCGKCGSTSGPRDSYAESKEWMTRHKRNCWSKFKVSRPSTAEIDPELLARARDTLRRLKPVEVPEPEAEKPKQRPVYVYARVGPFGTVSFVPPL